jgi:hypothetical protein
MKLNLDEIDTLLYCLAYTETWHVETIKTLTSEHEDFQKTLENRLLIIKGLKEKVIKQSLPATLDELSKQQIAKLV